MFGRSGGERSVRYTHIMFVYVLESKVDHSQYVGISERPQERLAEHNRGEVKSTISRRPWGRIWLEKFN